MIQIGKTLISEAIIDTEFTCNLSACKGECCVAGDAGAPLEEKELAILEDIYPKVKPYLREEGIAAIEAQGTHVMSDFNEPETPLVNGAECAYVTFSKDGMALCGIEKAYRDGKIDFKKPVSCELYPIRVQKLSELEAVNYDKWSICDAACSLGQELEVPVYKFTKNALIRKFGQDWYEALEKVVLKLENE
ncbi:Protein of unknown function [Psychroflexus salarius]|uniref:DUF3109 family protein n=1 Tax=Psychroflexus salarius TaxID=1155689 RepID=A0A1M4V2K7_9FLAO|nr:DUF3109 family protein [Psychroflexus salarius]SHE63118.1 Protein of unknown function [Psychroflexus salarius]